MKSFMDEIQYGSGPGGGTVVTLRKRIAGPQAGLQTTNRGGNRRMDVSERQADDVTILDLKGKITIGSGDVQLRNAMHAGGGQRAPRRS